MSFPEPIPFHTRNSSTQCIEVGGAVSQAKGNTSKGA